MHRARLVDRDDPARVACAIAKSVGPAPARNRLRRRFRAWAYHADLEPGFGYFVRFRPTAARLRWPELVAEFDAALARFP
jgi:ribonuclease P protein component